MIRVTPIDALLGSQRDATYAQCELIAKTIFGDSFTVAPVENQGSLSYTFVGTPVAQKSVISFRIEGGGSGKPDPNISKLAKQIHGDLVPDVAFCGHLPADSTNPDKQPRNLAIYRMPCLSGLDFWTVAGRGAELEETEAVAKRTTLVKSLARYFARAYRNQQAMTTDAMNRERTKALARISAMRKFLPQISGVLDEIEKDSRVSFGPFYPKVLTHGDLSGGNVLLDEATYEITGIVGWSGGGGAGASVQPFGVDLRSLFLTGGVFRADNVWQEYGWSGPLEAAFWEEFFEAAGIPAAPAWTRANIRRQAERLGRYATIVRFGFARRADGSVIDDAPLADNKELLTAWFGNPHEEGGVDEDEDEDEGEGEDDEQVEWETVVDVTEKQDELLDAGGATEEGVRELLSGEVSSFLHTIRGRPSWRSGRDRSRAKANDASASRSRRNIEFRPQKRDRSGHNVQNDE